MKAEIGTGVSVPQHKASERAKLLIHENLTKRDFEVAAAPLVRPSWPVQVYA
jgi:hypothetical protein